MRLSEALEKVSEMYLPGTVAYFGRMTPDPWQAAHDELERIAGVFDEAVVTVATERFISRCRELIERFRNDSKPSKSVAPADSFAMSRAAVDAHLSRKFKRCAECEGREGLKIVEVAPGSMDVKLLCSQCRGAA